VIATAARPAGHALGDEVLAHLETQIVSARRLLELVLRQGAAIRARDVESVLARVGELRGEMALRAELERERERLLAGAGELLQIAPPAITLEAITRLMAPAQAAEARVHSAELRGLLGEIAREHGINRALMRQELAFLDHLVRLLGDEPEAGYRPADSGGAAPAEAPRSPHRVLDLQA
jgi:FlgN protein